MKLSLKPFYRNIFLFGSILFLFGILTLQQSPEVNATHQLFCSAPTYDQPNCTGNVLFNTIGCFLTQPTGCGFPTWTDWDAASCSPSAFCGPSEHCTPTNFCGSDGNYYFRDINCNESQVGANCEWSCGFEGCQPRPSCDDACSSWSAGGACGVGCSSITESQRTRTCPPTHTECATTDCYPASGCELPPPSCSTQTNCQSGQLIRKNADCTTTTVDTCGGRGCTSSPLQCNPVQYTLTVSKTGGGTGTITSNPTGINCGGTCSALYNDGTPVTLTATPTGSDSFQSWSANCAPLVDPRQCQITLTSTQTVTATFNQAPQVGAGQDQDIDFACPTPGNCRVSATLIGSITDPDPYTVEWSLVAGDVGAVEIASPNSETTGVTFAASGNYTFKLQANDGSTIGSDTVDVIVRNNPPDVSIAGPVVREVDFGFPINLQGSATNDGLPNPPGALQLQWRKISGPGTVTFSNPTGATTNAQLSQAGVYDLRLEAADGEFTRQASVEIRYGAPGRYGLLPCGAIIDDPTTSWHETDSCELKHLFLLLQNLLNFALWKLVPLIIAVLVVATGAVFFFQFGGPGVLTKVRTIWSMVGKGVLILLFSWLFLNFLLGVLDFNINIFGRWYEISG